MCMKYELHINYRPLHFSKAYLITTLQYLNYTAIIFFSYQFMTNNQAQDILAGYFCDSISTALHRILTWLLPNTSWRWPRYVCTVDSVCIVSWHARAWLGPGFLTWRPFSTWPTSFAQPFPTKQPLYKQQYLLQCKTDRDYFNVDILVLNFLLTLNKTAKQRLS